MEQRQAVERSHQQLQPGSHDRSEPSPDPTVSFAVTARSIGEAARCHGLTVPAFRAPPRLVGLDRTIRRRGDHVTVAVRVRGRPWPAVVSDLIEGVIITNDLTPTDAGRVRAELWQAHKAIGDVAA
jgi:hypothetical protein